ncbi:MAG: hypothetical protein LUO93_02625 [Methanomicrobiales archaeon]|nr:hypothetical protein [Methanomicrobiales archaeon]
MPHNPEEGLQDILFRHAKDLLRITAIPYRKEVGEFRELIRKKLKEERLNIGLLLKEIQDNACQRAEGMKTKDPALHEYYMAVYAETSFLLSALTTERWNAKPGMAETA